MKPEDMPRWLRDYQEIFPEKSATQKQLDELKARIAELEKQSPSRKN